MKTPDNQNIMPRWLNSFVKQFALLLVLVLGLQFHGFSQKPISEDKTLFVEDNAKMLTAEEVSGLETRLKDYYSTTGHAIYIRTSAYKSSYEEAAQKGEDLVDILRYQVPASHVSTTVLYIDVYRYEDSDNSYLTTEIMRYDWDELANACASPTDTYRGRGPKNTSLISYRFQLKVLSHYSMDGDFNGGFEQSVDLIEQIHRGEIKSEDIDAAFFDSMLGTFFWWGLGFLLFMVTVVILGRRKGGGGGWGSYHNLSVGSSSRSAGGSSYGGSSDDGGGGGSSSGGGGSFGGGASGGGGSSSEW